MFGRNAIWFQTALARRQSKCGVLRP
jgi:hypothetical protein